ncbi:MAG: CpsD/CapB family tyrosine-protein kinase [Paracoccaceae bacterium]
MEKLEAAMARARELRKEALERPRAPGENAARKTTGQADWLMTLPEITISKALALKNRLSAVTGGKEGAPYDMLRSRTTRMMKDKGWTRLAITSPGATCGKTTVALNLALSLSRQKDFKVMLIDLDLRRPSLHRVLGASSRKSMHEVLEGKAAFTEASYRIGDNLIVGLNVSASKRPAELLQSEATRDALNEIERNWRPDLMLFDMSPILASDDNVGFLPNVDCALLIAAAESTTLANIDICEKELAQLTNVLGVVLNKCRYEDDSVGYNYGTYG